MAKAKKILSLILALMMIFTLAACGSDDTPAATPGNAAADTPAKDDTASKDDAPAKDDKVYTWRIGIGNGGTEEGNPIIYYMCRVAEKAEELSGGRLKVEQYLSGTLGTNAELPQGLVDGTVDSAILPSQFFTSTVPDLYVIDLYGMFADGDEMIAALEQAPAIKEHALQKGIHIGAYLKLYPRCTITVDPVDEISDFQGKKLWFATSKVLSNKLETLGGVPCNFAGSELAVSLQNGTVDGAWCDMSMMKNNALYDFAKYVIKTPGEPMGSLFCISDMWLQSLPEDLQEIVLQVAAECAPLEHERADIVSGQLEGLLVDNGVTVTEPSAEFVAELEAALATEAEWMLKTYPEAQEAYDQVTAALGK